MKLAAYLKKNHLEERALASLLGVARFTVVRWMNGDVIPEPPFMRRLVEITKGQVMPNDFFSQGPPVVRRKRGRPRKNPTPEIANPQRQRPRKQRVARPA